MGDILDEVTAGTPRPSQSHPRVAAEPGLVVLHRGSGLRGSIVRLAGEVVVIADARGAEHGLRNLPGAFAVQGETVTLVQPAAGAAPARRTTASGAVVATDGPARVARASRLWVEGDHDARLVERVWGDELRDLGVVVEPIGGLDNLPGALEAAPPASGAVVAVLADHLVEGTKEWRIAAEARSDRWWRGRVVVVGHPFVDIWQCVRPAAVGIEAWPEVPRGEDWKQGVCDRLGWGDPRDGWRRVLGSVDSFVELEPELVGALEAALDALVGDGSDPP